MTPPLQVVRRPAGPTPHPTALATTMIVHAMGVRSAVRQTRRGAETSALTSSTIRPTAAPARTPVRPTRLAKTASACAHHHRALVVQLVARPAAPAAEERVARLARMASTVVPQVRAPRIALSAAQVTCARMAKPVAETDAYPCPSSGKSASDSDFAGIAIIVRPAGRNPGHWPRAELAVVTARRMRLAHKPPSSRRSSTKPGVGMPHLVHVDLRDLTIFNFEGY